MAVPRFPRWHRKVPRFLAPLRSAGWDLADETDAFLAGRLAQHLLHTDQPIPRWALLNRLAHGSVRELEEVVATRLGGGPELPLGELLPWAVAERTLALRLLAGARGPGEVRVAQRQVLVPLELSLIEQDRAMPLTAGAVIDAATTALDDRLLGR